MTLALFTITQYDILLFNENNTEIYFFLDNTDMNFLDELMNDTDLYISVMYIKIIV